MRRDEPPPDGRQVVTGKCKMQWEDAMFIGSRVRQFTLVALAALSLASGVQAQEKKNVTMALASNSFATLPAKMVKELGFFDKHGLNVKFVVMENASTATAGLISGSADMALSGPGEWVLAQGRGQQVVAIARGYNGLGATLVLGKRVVEKLGVAADAPIEQRLKALDGLVIAAPSPTGAYTVAIKGAAEAAGANIRFTYMALPAMNAAMESGAVAGYIGGAPFWPAALKTGSGVVWISGPKGEILAKHSPVSTSNLQVMRPYAEAHPEIIEATIAAFNDMGKALDENPTEGRAALGRLYPDIDADTLDILYKAESGAWRNKPYTEADIRQEIAFVLSTGLKSPQINSVRPTSMVYP
jgi:ABC-type nitrate/sulfonate/bicarbonate transport system substrate-binding protein